MPVPLIVPLMRPRLTEVHIARLGGLLLVLALLAGTTPATAETSGNLPGGTAISVDITSPADGTLVADPPGGFQVAGEASVGEGVVIADTTLIYVLDVSGSTDFPDAPGCGGDQNSDGEADRVLDCEIAALKALNQEAITAGTVDEVGLVVFATDADSADLGPSAGQQDLTGPGTDADSMAGSDVEQVLESAFSDEFGGDGGVNEFTVKTLGNTTNYEAAVQEACSLAQTSSNPNNIVAFMSDGEATAGGDATDDVPCSPDTATFQTFAVGDQADCDNTGFDGQGSLRQIAEATGGECRQVTSDNIDELVEVVPGVIDSKLTAIDISVDGDPFQAVDTTSAALPQLGPVTVGYSHTVSGLAPGDHEIRVRATGTDAGGEGSVIDTIAVTVADITLTPASDTNELTGSDDEHTVTATVAAGADGGVSGIDVSFEILVGPNAGETASATTDANGEATFTYTATQGLGGLGTDTIEACFTDDLENEACDDAEKEWVDTTPPAVACEPTENPSGKQEPQGGTNSPGQNEDGFYELLADDAVDPDPELFVRDTGSGTVFGPFADGTKIKYTEDEDATPQQKKMGGSNSDVDWHIIGNGDAELFGVDASGNESDPVECLVPKPSK